MCHPDFLLACVPPPPSSFTFREQYPLAEERLQHVGSQVVPTQAAISALKALQQRIDDHKVGWIIGGDSGHV